MELSLEQVEAEIAEKTRDWQVFSDARAMIRARVLEVRDSTSPLTPLPTWSGTDAVLGSLDLAIHAMEHTLEELKALRRVAKPRLTLIDGGADGAE